MHDSTWIRTLAVACVVAGAIGSARADAAGPEDAKPAPGVEFSDAVGCFSARFPSAPAEHQDDKHTFIGTIEERWFAANTGEGLYLVGFTHLPELMMFFGGHDLILHKAKDVFLKREQAKALSFKDQPFQGMSAKRLTFERSNGGRGKAYFLFVGRRLYIVLGQSRTDPSEVERFLNSFRLNPACVET